MKIWINHFDVASLYNKLKNISCNGQKITGNQKIQLIYENSDGQFYLQNEKLYKITYSNESDVFEFNNYMTNVSVIMDNSIEHVQEVFTVPVNPAIVNSTTSLTLSLPNNDIHLVLFGKGGTYSIYNSIDCLETISEFYFETTSADIHSDVFKKSLNEFLSVLI
tara:strand:+ start:1271 stop:1762 length:492 start_codon:yes stop_codon:yes gene_type:complete